MSYQKGLVSIIVPVYNTDPILMKKCLRSISRQTYSNVEILFINDGSTNKETLSLLKKLNNEPGYHVINKSNEGVSAARNLGIKKANGDYVFFLDSDDYIGSNTIEVLVRLMDSGSYVAAIAKMITVKNGKNSTFITINDRDISIDRDFELIVTNTVIFASQGILFRTKYAKKHNFRTDLKFGEDLLYSLNVFSEGLVAYSNAGTYYYVQNDMSATHNTKYLERYLEDFNYIYREISNNYPENIDIISYMAYDKINLVLNRFCIGNNVSFRKYRETAKKFRHFLLSYKKPKMISSNLRDLFVYLYYREYYYLHYVLMRLKVLWGKRDEKEKSHEGYYG